MTQDPSRGIAWELTGHWAGTPHISKHGQWSSACESHGVGRGVLSFLKVQIQAPHQGILWGRGSWHLMFRKLPHVIVLWPDQQNSAVIFFQMCLVWCFPKHDLFREYEGRRVQ